MKKKVLAISLVVALLAIAVVGGSLAWFTDTDSVENTFTVGSIKVQQNETNADGSDFTQNQTMLPVVDMNNPSTDPNYIHKVVTVSNTGNNAAYVRTFIAVDSRIADYLYLDLNVADGWRRDADQTATIGDSTYKVLVFTYTNELTKGATTPTLLKGVYLDAKMDVKDNNGVQEFCYRNGDAYTFTGYPVSSGVQVYVATQAVQADGFADADAALSGAFGGALPSFS